MPSLYEARKARAQAIAERLESRRALNCHRRRLLAKHGRNDTGYHPARIRRQILSILTPEWTSSTTIHNHLREIDPSVTWPRIQSVLDFMADHFRIERGSLYKHPRKKGASPHSLDELAQEPPPGTHIPYAGHAYRLNPYSPQTILAMLDRLQHHPEEHPRKLAEEFSTRVEFAYKLWHSTQHHEEELDTYRRHATSLQRRTNNQ